MTIQVREITKSYKKNRGVEAVNFALHPGEVVALVGANGAGKSTIIKILTSQTKVDAGEILYEDEYTLRYMPDDLSFPDTLTAKEILQMLGSLRHVSANRLAEVLQFVGLENASHLKVSQFSKGMRQRLNLAQSMLGDGKLYILDEPTNGLDPFWIAKLKKYLVEEKQQQHIILFSTHLLSLAEEIADAVVMIDEGQVLVTGSVNTLLNENNCENLEQLWLKLTKKDVLL